MEIVNLTPHPITLLVRTATVDGQHMAETRLTFASAGVARVETIAHNPRFVRETQIGERESFVGGELTHTIPVTPRPTFGAIVGLPEAPADGTLYVVSGVVAAAAAARTTEIMLEAEHMAFTPAETAELAMLERLVSPGTGPGDEPERNEAGQITAVRRLIRAI